MAATQEDKKLAAEILCAFVRHESHARTMLRRGTSGEVGLEMFWDRLIKLVARDNHPQREVAAPGSAQSRP